MYRKETMLKLKRILNILALSGIAVLWLTPDTHGYIDPSTGSYILQILLAGLLGALFTLKIFWRNFKGFFGRLFARSGKDDVKSE